MKTSSFEEVKNLYEGTADSYNEMMDSEIRHPMYHDVLSRLAKRIRSLSGAVIDTACGSGHMLALYFNIDSSHPMLGVDLSPKMVEIAGKRLETKAKTMVGNMLKLSEVPTGSCVTVINYFAIHHLNPTELSVALHEWNRVLIPQGQLILAAWEGEGAIDYGGESEVIALRYSQDQVASSVQEAGFKIDRQVVEPVEEMPMDAIYLEATKQ